jgi:hypothetical protein
MSARRGGHTIGSTRMNSPESPFTRAAQTRSTGFAFSSSVRTRPNQSARGFCPAWLASREGNLVLTRMRLEASSVSEDIILANSELAWYLGQFVFGRMASLRA